MEGTHGPDVSALVGSSFTASEGVAVNRHGVKGQFLLAAKERAERDYSVAEDIEYPLLPDST